jgi:hypothetical protein
LLGALRAQAAGCSAVVALVHCAHRSYFYPYIP